MSHGFVVVQPDTDWAPYMVASDIALTDHTSLAVNYALLNKPMLYVSVPDASLVKGAPVHELSEILPRLEGVDKLEEGLLTAFSEFPREQVAKIARECNSYPGEAADRIKKEIYGVLKLAPLLSARD